MINTKFCFSHLFQSGWMFNFPSEGHLNKCSPFLGIHSPELFGLRSRFGSSYSSNITVYGKEHIKWPRSVRTYSSVFSALNWQKFSRIPGRERSFPIPAFSDPLTWRLRDWTWDYLHRVHVVAIESKEKEACRQTCSFFPAFQLLGLCGQRQLKIVSGVLLASCLGGERHST